MQRKNLAASPNSHNRRHQTSLTGLSTGQKANRPEPHKEKRAKKTKEAREERGTFSCRGDMRDFVFLEQSYAGGVIRYRTYQPEVMCFRSSAESDVLRFIRPKAIVYGPINQKGDSYWISAEKHNRK